MSGTSSPWEEWAPGHNPYRRTPFQVLALPPTVSGRGAIRAAIRQRRQRIRSAPERFTLFGQRLDVADVNEAEERVLDPEARLYAELCTHRVRRTPADPAPEIPGPRPDPDRPPSSPERSVPRIAEP